MHRINLQNTQNIFKIFRWYGSVLIQPATSFGYWCVNLRQVLTCCNDSNSPTRLFIFLDNSRSVVYIMLNENGVLYNYFFEFSVNINATLYEKQKKCYTTIVPKKIITGDGLLVKCVKSKPQNIH